MEIEQELDEVLEVKKELDLKENKTFISPEDYARLVSQGDREEMDRLLEYQIIKFKETKQREGRIKVKGEYANIINEEISEYKLKLDDCFDTKHGNIIVDVSKFADFLLERFTFKTIFGAKSSLIYVYEDGIYVLKGNEIIETFSERELGEHCKNNVVKEIKEKIKRKTAIEFDVFDKTPINLIPLKNGVYNIETDELEKHNPERYFKFQLPITFNKNKTCPTFNKFLKEMLYEDDLDLMQEWFGFCLYRRYLFKKGMIWFGETDTGKTTLINVLEGLIGESNCSGLSLHEISNNDRFGLKSLHNQHLNSYDDLSSNDLSDGGGFKMATGGGRITAEFKFGDMFKFLNFSKLLFACNSIPSPKNIEDNAYFSRWFPIAFDNQIEAKEQNPNLDNDCLKEASGILNWALIGLKRLLENKRFTFNKTPAEVKAIMCRSGNPLFAFVQDCLNEQEGFWLSKEDLYNSYCEYMNKEKLPKMTKDKFGKNILRHCNYLIDSKQGNDRGWRNARVGGYVYDKINKNPQKPLS